MDKKDFTSASWGRVARSLGGVDAFIPRDLPPYIEYRDGLMGPLSAADRALGQLAGITRTMPNPMLLIRSFINREAVLSSRIEGTQASLSDLFLFEVAPTVENSVPDVREVYNYVRALEHGLKRLRQIPLTLNVIKELHAILLEKVRGQERHPGEFRRVQNWIGPQGCSIHQATYVPPPPEHLMSALSALERFINTPNDVPLLVRLAMIHYQFEAIHPFEDGNGRIGRLLISLLLDSERALPHPVLYLSAYFERFRPEYYDRLLAVSQRGQWNQWIVFFLRGVTDQSIDAVERASRLMALRNDWANHCKTARTSALLIKLVDELFHNPFVNLARAVSLLGVRPQSAQNTIDRLIGMGILREITGRRRNRIYVARRVLEILEQAPAFDPGGQGG